MSDQESIETEPIPFEIWSEGYRATGESAGAHYHGIGTGRTFEEACINFFKGREDASYFDSARMTYWGCKLYDSESKARESFG